MLALPACENDMDAEIENLEGVLCLNAVLRTGSESNFVHISRTSRTRPAEVSDAVVKLYVNDNLVETVTDCYSVTHTSILTSERFDDDMGWINVEEEKTITDTLWGTYLLKSKFNEGDVVRIDVTSGGQHVWAEDVAPQKIENAAATFTYIDNPYGYGRDRVSLDVSFNDISGGNDYYRMSIYSDFYRDVRYFRWLNPYDVDIFEKDSLIDYARRNFDKPLFKNETETYVEVYYLENRKEDTYHNGYEEYSYRGCLILSEGEGQSASTDEDDDSDFDMLLSDVKNTYRVFSDHLFNNSKANLNVTVKCPVEIYDHVNRSYNDDFTEEELDLEGEFYNWKLMVNLQSLSAQQYYYLRALNAITSPFYDETSNLSGAMKLPSNVRGGSGNFSVMTQTTVEVPVLVDYRPPFYDTDPIYW